MISCSTCIHWHGFPWKEEGKNVASRQGECREDSPIIVVKHGPHRHYADRGVMETEVDYSAWPVTKNDDVCGKHKPMSSDTPY